MITLPGSLGGFYRVTIKRRDGSTRYQSHWMPNIITNAGLDRFGQGDFMSNCRVGTGTTTPHPEDNALVQEAASTSSRANEAASAEQYPPYAGTRSVDFTFPEGTFNSNLNLSEVGVGWSSQLFSRALFVDINGNTTSVTVLSDEILVIRYKLYNYAPTEDVVFTRTLQDGQTVTCTARAAQVRAGSQATGWGIRNGNHSGDRCHAYSGDIGDIQDGPSGSASDVSLGAASYEHGSFSRVYAATWSLSQANFDGGIRSVRFRTSGRGVYQVQFDPPIPKTNDYLLALSFQVSWARA